MISMTIAAVFAVFLLTAPASAQTARNTTPMLKSGDAITYEYRPYGSIVIGAMVKEIGGKTAVCGFWAVKERMQAYVLSTQLVRKTRQKVSVNLGNRRLLTGVEFMNEVDLDDFKAGTRANCEVTNVPWQAGFAGQDVEFGAPRLRVFE